MGRRSDPRWRDRAASELAASLLPGMELEGRALVVDDPERAAQDTLRSLGVEVERWSRMDRPGGDPGTPWPPPGPFSLALVRLPRSRDALDYALHAVTRVLGPGGRVLVYGAKDEGIGSTPARMNPRLANVTTLATARRCRVLEGRWEPPPEEGDEDGGVSRWRAVRTVDLGWGPTQWVSYPGTFARGGIDPGTRLLLDHLPDPRPGGRVLDFAAGTGVLAAGLLRKDPSLRVELVEPDALAREAARENVPGAAFLPLDDWWTRGGFDAVVSNPPVHDGKSETLEVVADLVTKGAGALLPGGELRMVVLRRLPVDRLLAEGFSTVEAVADDGPYRVWRASSG